MSELYLVLTIEAYFASRSRVSTVLCYQVSSAGCSENAHSLMRI